MNKPQLFLLHFAGGNYYSFDFLKPHLADWQVVPLELPGRGKRMQEDLLSNFELAANDLYDQLVKKITTPGFVIYGHSMGAYLGLRVANRLQATGKPPAYLVVSGNPGPGIKDPKRRYLMDQQDFRAELTRLGGIPDELLENEELFNYFEPILRADFEIAENSHLDQESPVQCPLFAMMGSREEKADQIANWGRFTQSTFGHEILEGDHFFIYKHPQRLAAILKNCGQAISRPQYQ